MKRRQNEFRHKLFKKIKVHTVNILSWSRTSVSEELWPLLETLREEYPVNENSPTGIKLSFSKQAKGLDVEISRNTAFIKYSSLSTAARGIGKVLAGEKKISEKLPFDTFGILIDCSRNATLKVDYLKKYLCRLSLMGYNMAMLYTKDAYELPGEDFFGYLRGRYSLKDLQEDQCLRHETGNRNDWKHSGTRTFGTNLTMAGVQRYKGYFKRYSH